jgi:hypothetical protein
VDQILSEPQPMFNVIKHYFPSYVYGRGRRGHVVIYDKLGGIDVKAMQEQGVTLVSHSYNIWCFTINLCELTCMMHTALLCIYYGIHEVYIAT